MNNQYVICKVKNKIDLVSEIVNNTQKLSDSFSSEESPSGGSNIITMKCTKTLFTKEGLVNNISSYVLSVSMIYFLLSILLFIKCGYRLLANDINQIISSKKEIKAQGKVGKKITNNDNDIDNAPPKKKVFKAEKKLEMPKSVSNSKLKLNNDIGNKKKSILSMDKNMKFKKRNKPAKNKKLEIKNKIKNSILKRRSKTNFNQKHITNNITNNIVNTMINNNIENKIPINIKLIKFNNFELNTLEYQTAINYDKRTFFEYYIALIRIKHPLFFAFCPIKD